MTQPWTPAHLPHTINKTQLWGLVRSEANQVTHHCPTAGFCFLIHAMGINTATGGNGTSNSLCKLQKHFNSNIYVNWDSVLPLQGRTGPNRKPSNSGK